MELAKVSQEEFSVIGLQVRTTNAQEMSGAGKIPGLWGQFYSEQIASKISGKISDEIFAVYHDYESDANGEYSLTVGVKVKAGTAPAAGLKLVQIPQQSYTRLTTDKGEMPGIVIEGWKQIWNMTMQSELKRKYTADFEVYDQRCADPKSSQVDIFIASSTP